MVLGLARMRELLARLGTPQQHLGTVIHVGGTNGKGSTVAMLAAIAGAAGVRTARYSSPHLSSLRERIVVADEMISEADFVDHAERVAAAGGDEFTFFEQITAIALSYFAASNVALTILEVGLGGRLDATNVVDADVAVVTGVDMDHEAILGTTPQQIAFEKAGIFKTGRGAVIGLSGLAAATPHLLAHARAVGAGPVLLLNATDIAAVPHVALAGHHQRCNAAAALAALDVLALQQPPLTIRFSASVRAAGLAHVRHPGRFERLTGTPTVILDGAHNPAGAAALARTLRDELGYQRQTTALVLAVSADKPVAAMLAALAPHVGLIVATRYQQDRAMAALDVATFGTEAAAAWATGVPPPLVVSAESLLPALALAGAWPGVERIVVAGSLFLVGEARTALCNAPCDPLVVTDPSATPPTAPVRSVGQITKPARITT